MAEPRTKAGAPLVGALAVTCCGTESMNRMWEASTRLRSGHRRILVRLPTQPFACLAGRVHCADGIVVFSSGRKPAVRVGCVSHCSNQLPVCQRIPPHLQFVAHRTRHSSPTQRHAAHCRSGSRSRRGSRCGIWNKLQTCCLTRSLRGEMTMDNATICFEIPMRSLEETGPDSRSRRGSRRGSRCGSRRGCCKNQLACCLTISQRVVRTMGSRITTYEENPTRYGQGTGRDSLSLSRSGRAGECGGNHAASQNDHENCNCLYPFHTRLPPWCKRTRTSSCFCLSSGAAGDEETALGSVLHSYQLYNIVVKLR